MPYKSPERIDFDSLRRRSNKDDWTDDAKSGGASLELGSTEYNEYVMDHQGINEFDQEKAKLDRGGERSEDVFEKERSQGEDAQKETAQQQRDREVMESGILSTAERKISHQIRKAAMLAQVEGIAIAKAKVTPTLSDDRAARRLPKELNEAVYDDGVQDDDFYAGARILKKYD